MEINWYPGHMAVAFREIEKIQKNIDILIHVLDARMPFSSINPKLIQVFQNKPVVFLLNKTDLVENKHLEKTISTLKEKGYFSFKVNGLTGSGISGLHNFIKKNVVPSIFEKRTKRGIQNNKITALIAGTPNVGKSSLVNRFSLKKVANVENKAGVTRLITLYRLNPEFDLFDTPGLLWPKLEQNSALNLALLGSIPKEILPLDEICIYALKYITKHFPGLLKSKYGIDENKSVIELLDSLCIKTGSVLKGKEPDYERVYVFLIKDIQNGKIGKLYFDLPSIEEWLCYYLF